jgi:predicted ATPase/class 3 adenylate cyclase
MPRDREARLAVVRDYHAMAAEVVQRFDGNLAQAQGERLLVYFGYPRAHEDDVRRAVLTGLGMVEGMVALNRHRQPDSAGGLAVQVGIHTGVELVGAAGQGDQRTSLVVGETPTIAAGLQRLAPPDTVVISRATWRLVEGYVVYEVLGTYMLEDLSEPLTVYRVLQESTAHSRFDVAIMRGLTPFVGREHELGLLHECWAQATEGSGQVVVLRGEAGIGKSRLVQVFNEQLTGQTYARLEYHCSPYYQHTALYPVVTFLQRLLRFRPGESADERLHKLEGLLEKSGVALKKGVPLWAALLSLPLPACYPPLPLTPQAQRQKTLEALLVWLLIEAQRHPVCVLVEDLHWADPSTLEWLTLLIDQVPTTRVLLLLVCRAEFPLPWAARAHLSQVTLRRLSRPHVETMVQRLTDSKALPTEVLHHLVATTDGVPLFVEELTKTVLESGLVKEREGHYELAGSLHSLAIPATLHDSLMARLDRLGPAKQLAQLGATLGREFPYELIQAVAAMDEATLQQGLMQLVDAELLYQRGLPPQARYSFKHVLIQDAAYQSLLRSTRRQYHRQIAQVLEERLPETRETHPELLAHHYTAAGLAAKAVSYWQRAGQRAIERSAHVEAISHLTKGLELLKTLPDTPERAQHELTLQLALGAPLLMIKGHTAPEVEHAYSRARELCLQVGESPHLFSALVGLWRFYLNRARFQTARELGEQCFALAQNAASPTLLQEAHMMLGSTLFYLGEPVSARSHLEQGIALYNSEHSRSRAFSSGTDPGVACLSWAAWTLWMLGYPERALTKIQEALTLAQELSHAYSLCLALHYASTLHTWRREVQLAQEKAEAVIAVSSEQGFVRWLAGGMIRRGWIMAEQGSPEEGIVQLRQGLATWQAIGGELGLPSFLALLAEAYKRVGQAEEGLRVLADALAAAHRNAQHYYDAELYRLKGELLLQQVVGGSLQTAYTDTSRVALGPTHASLPQTEAESSFRQAIEVARHQDAKSLELRAIMSLSRLWQQQGRRAEARQMLAGIYGWFTEGFGGLDLQEAKALLEAL